MTQKVRQKVLEALRNRAYFGYILVSQSAHYCTPTPHQDEGLGLFSTSPTIPKGWA
jgi:hypothetical protein